LALYREDKHCKHVARFGVGLLKFKLATTPYIPETETGRLTSTG